MTGSSGNGVILTARDHQLLSELTFHKLLNREQVKVAAGFSSTTSVNIRLLKLTHAGFLRRFFLPTRAGGRAAVYALSAKGAALAGYSGRLIQRTRDALLIGDLFVTHQLSINDEFLQLRCRALPGGARLKRQRNFSVPLAASCPLIPDGYFEIETSEKVQSLFFEVDLGTEPLRVWARKVELYVKLAVSGEFESLFGQPRFRVLVAASSERRLSGIRKTAVLQTDKIFWFSTLDDINREGLFARIWQKSIGDKRLPLL
ncbi:MAG: replication-relaxation family protein [Acidobacteriales bacterium]|nr:replication-relaxation family protein [Terriglobales bacterium]